MKTKTIKQVLRKRFDEFLKSIDDPKVKNLVSKNSIITGGSIASMLKGEDVNDFDIYFTTRETVLAVCKYYINQFRSTHKSAYPSFKIMEEPIGGFPSFVYIEESYNRAYPCCDSNFIDKGAKANAIDPNGRIKIRIQSAGVAAEDGFKFDEQEESNTASMTNLPDDKDLTGLPPEVQIMKKKERKKWLKANAKKPFRPVYISANAITLSDQFQLIIRFYGSPEEIHENYDYAHCTCQWTSADSKLVLPSEALECLLTNELRYKGSKYPLASIIRSRKFINRGMTINAGQYLKMCMQLNDMDLRDLSVLEDQLIGVDAVYFAQMLKAIPFNRKINNKIDTSYLIEMIDKFF